MGRLTCCICLVFGDVEGVYFGQAEARDVFDEKATHFLIAGLLQRVVSVSCIASKKSPCLVQ
jgi:hypothetical protein